MKTLTPRLPTAAEQAAIAAIVVDEGGLTADEALLEVECAAVAVFDGYISDGPGYFGRVAIVVWGGGPECNDTFTFGADGQAARCSNFRLTL